MFVSWLFVCLKNILSNEKENIKPKTKIFFYYICSQKDIANMKNEIEKQQREGDNNAAAIEEKTHELSSDEPSDKAAENNESAISNGANAVNQQQTAAKMVAC